MVHCGLILLLLFVYFFLMINIGGWEILHDSYIIIDIMHIIAIIIWLLCLKRSPYYKQNKLCYYED